MIPATIKPRVHFPRGTVLRATIATFTLLVGATLSGCGTLGALVGGMAESYKRSTPRTVEADSTILQGKSFAVLVTADRMIESQHPGIASELIGRISERLRENAGASGYVPPMVVIQYIANNPAWITRTHSEIAKQLDGVQRLIIIEVTEFSTNEAGNQYVWDGVASATLGVAEIDGPLPDDFAYQKSIRVKFPDKGVTTSSEMSRELIVGALLARLVDRATWLFYKHEEPHYITY